MSDLYQQAINRVAKWRRFFTSWQLGTRLDTDGEARAVSDHRELSILLRIETNALAALLIKKGIFTQEEFTRVVAEEAELLNATYEKCYPGFTASDIGLTLKLPEAAETMKRLGFPK